MTALLSDTSSHDVYFATDEETDSVGIPAHRIVMACLSEPFRALLKGDFAERTKDTIVLRSISKDAIRQFVNFAYTGCIDASDGGADLALELLVAADQWQVSALRHECEWLILEKYLCHDTVFDCLNVAVALSANGRDSFLTEVK